MNTDLSCYLPGVIGLSGPAGAGKDTAAAYLVEYHGYKAMAFADPLRAMLGVVLDMVGAPTSLWLSDRSLKEREIPGLGVSPRAFLQAMGTEGGRALSSDIWVRVAQERIEADWPSHPSRRYVFTDARFENEWAWIRELGGRIWRIERPGLQPVRPHISETAAAALQPDWTLHNNGTVAALWAQIEEQLVAPEPAPHGVVELTRWAYGLGTGPAA